MKTPQPKSPSPMNPATRAAVLAVLDTDATLTAQHRARIIAACDSMTDEPQTTPPRGMSASAAAKYLGKHPATLSRWIAEGRLTGEKVEGRFLLSLESVESLRSSLAKPSPAAPAPLPSRLAHLSNRITPP